MALVRAVGSFRDAQGLTNQQLVERAGMSSSYYYARLRGDAPFDTNDIEKLAAALGTHPHELSRVAASYQAGNDDFEPRVELDRGELARRLSLVAAAPRADGTAFDETELLQQLADRGVSVDAGEWAELLKGRSGPVRSRVLEGIAAYAGVSRSYLVDLDDAEASEAAEAQFDFRMALRESGADSISARAVGEVSPAALRAIAQSLRSISPR